MVGPPYCRAPSHYDDDVKRCSYRIGGECAFGGSCQKNEGGDGPFCFFDDGAALPEGYYKFSCASGKWFKDAAGTKRCSYQIGGDCSQDSKSCGIGLECSGGICKAQLTEPCDVTSHCLIGTCQRDIYGWGPRCYLNEDEAIPDDAPVWESCANHTYYDDHGTLRCGERLF